MTRCYAWPLTVRGGANLSLHVSTEHRQFGVRLFRYGTGIEEVRQTATIHEGVDLPFGRPDEAWGWPRYEVAVTEETPDGIYVAVPVAAGLDGALEPVEVELSLLNRPDACLFILRRDGSEDAGRILLKLPTATYAAYNQLGGTSLYAGARWARDWSAQGYVVSLQRPGNGGVGGRVMEGDAPDVYSRDSRRQTFAHWDAPLVAWLEESGYRPAYCTDFDLHYDATLLGSAALLVCSGHDEYWSEEMRQRVLEFVDKGRNVCFFAGDVAEWRIDFSSAGDRLFCRKMRGGSPGGDRTQVSNAIWHVTDPEDWLTMSSWAWGGGWWDGRRTIEAYRPLIPCHWAFDGVDFPTEGITGGKATPVIGYEADGVQIERASDPPRLSAARRGGDSRAILAFASLSTGWVANSEGANTAMLFRTAPSGGMVFSVGSTDWSLGLNCSDAVRGITGNVVRRLAHRTLQIHGPICDENAYLEDRDTIGPDVSVAWYVDGAQAESLALSSFDWTIRGGDRVSGAQGSNLVTRSAEVDRWLTVTATVHDPAGTVYFGSRTVRVLTTEEFLRHRIVRALHAMAHPDEQGGALVDQRASEAALATRVIPVRLGWVQKYLREVGELVEQLEEIWVADGRMADGALREDEK